jgi:hypothetical protein
LSISSASRHSEYSIGQLTVKQICFFLDTPEIVPEFILIQVVVFPEIDLVIHNVSIIKTSFSIRLVELALVIVDASTVIYLILARKYFSCGGVRDIKQPVYMFATILSCTVALTWNCCDATSSINYECLRLSIASKVGRDIKIL